MSSQKNSDTKEIQIILPKMGESVMEAVVTNWLKKSRR
mgnify:CR=1 FL=1